MTETTDPWKPIQPPDQTANVSGRRVDANLPWALFWAVDSELNCLLMLQHDPVNQPKNKLPKLKGLDVETRMPADHGPAVLIIRLKDKEQREIFFRLCQDIVSATRLAKTEEEAVERFLARTWRWHKLLRGGRDGRLSDEEQKGLIGELGVLRKLLFPVIGHKSSVLSWSGPLGAPKDFEVGRVCIEVKSRRGAATPFVTVSNEFQFDTEGVDALFLLVAEITSGADGDITAKTITEITRTVLNEIEKNEPSIAESFEERLLAIGFDWADDYSDKRWVRGPEHVFRIAPEFPCITQSMCPSGVSSVRYSIGLQDCENFRSDTDAVKIAILGEDCGNQH